MPVAWGLVWKKSESGGTESAYLGRVRKETNLKTEDAVFTEGNEDNEEERFGAKATRLSPRPAVVGPILRDLR
jgi:hypothetical protein